MHDKQRHPEQSSTAVAREAGPRRLVPHVVSRKASAPDAVSQSKAITPEAVARSSSWKRGDASSESLPSWSGARSVPDAVTQVDTTRRGPTRVSPPVRFARQAAAPAAEAPALAQPLPERTDRGPTWRYSMVREALPSSLTGRAAQANPREIIKAPSAASGPGRLPQPWGHGPLQTARVRMADHEAVRGHATQSGPMAKRAQRKVAVDFGYGKRVAAERERAPLTPDATGMPGPVRAKMEGALGADFSEVRVHPESSRAAELGALAFTQGNDVHVAPGQWAPQTPKGQQLLGHELTHVVQQRNGRVEATAQGLGAGLNDDPALEREADVLGAKAARGEMAASAQHAPHGSRRGEPAQARMDPALRAASSTQSAELSVPPNAVVNPGGESVSLSEDASPPVQAKGPTTPIQAHGLAPIQRQPIGKKTLYVPHQIKVTQPMSGEEYKVAAMRQVFGAVFKNLNWQNIKESYVPEGSPYTLYVEVNLLKRLRGEAAKARGFDVGAGGRIAGAEGRARQFETAPPSDVKTALLNEIDQRYYEATGTHTKIKPGEKGKARLWFTIRDEVLFQHEYIANLPPKVKELIKSSIKGRELTPADYDRLFAIAKRIEKMPAGQVSDYASKVTGTTTDLSAFEAALDRYLAEMAERQRQAEERDVVKTKLGGLEAVYKLYRQYRSMLLLEATSAGMALGAAQSGVPGVAAPLPIGPTASGMMRKELEAQLQARGFASISEFESYIKEFEKAFAQGAASIAKDLLAKYSGKLYQESERYKDQSKLSALHRDLAGFRADYAEFEKNATIANEYTRQSELSRLPGSAHLRPKIGADEAKAAYDRAVAAKQAAQSEIQGLASAHPIFQEEGLPPEERIDKVALAKAGENDLGGLIQAHIATRMKAVDKARSEIVAKPELIYKMDKLMPRFYVQLGITPGSIYDLIIQDKLKDDAILKLATGIAVAIVAIALAVVSLGTATPAIVAAGAAAAGFGLSAYMAYDEYLQYTEQKGLADVGFADDPSVVWLVVAIAGATLDMAAAFKAIKALGPAAKALEPGGDLSQFSKAVRALEKSHEIDSKLAEVAERSAAARAKSAEASKGLVQAMAKVYSLPGPLADPEVYRAVLRLAYYKLKELGLGWEKFFLEFQQARVAAKLGDLSPDELLRLKQAYGQAKALSGLDAEVFERFVSLEQRAFNRFAALDQQTLSKFFRMDAGALRKFGALPDDVFARFAKLDEATLNKLSPLSEGAMTNLQKLDDATLKALGETNPAGLGRLEKAKNLDTSAKVGSGEPWKGSGSPPQWAKPESKAYKHVLGDHGADRLKTPERVWDRMRNTRRPQGIWRNDDLVVEAERLAPPYKGEYILDMGKDVGDVFELDGSITKNVSRVFLRRGPDGELVTAYPISSRFTGW